MVANRRNLTDTRIDALSGDGHRRPELRDLEVPGLIVRAAANRKVFALHARFPGQKHPTRRVIAEVGTITIDQARQIARDWHALIRDGVNPADEMKRKAEAEKAARHKSCAASRRAPAFRHRPRRVGSARLAQKAEGSSDRLIKTADRIRRGRREAVFLFASPCPLLAQSRHERLHRTCLLSGVKRT
jgi:Arm DNA-binding domain